jgi:hypothetical protein
MRRALLCATLLCATTSLLVALPAAAQARPSALIVFVPGTPQGQAGPDVDIDQPDTLLRAFDALPGLAVGLTGMTQGKYTDRQGVLDLTQGTRVSPITYSPRDAPRLALVGRGGGGVISGWRKALQRAQSAPANLRPGLLAQRAGGAAYVGFDGSPALDAVVAADRSGRVAEVSSGPASTLPARIAAALATHRLVVADLPRGAAARGGLLATLLASRPSDALVIALQTPPDAKVLQLVPIGVAGGIGDRGLRSETTRRDGVVASIDVLPTVLHQLGKSKPDGVTGERITGAPRVSPRDLETLRERYAHIAPRRIRSLGLLLVAFGALVGAFALAGARARGFRVAAIGLFWLPVVVLVPGALDPASGLTEAGLVIAGTVALGVLTDRLVRWPYAPVVPALVTILVYLVDLAAGSGLITLSMLGPNPRAGARFFGIGNELEPTLPILVFFGLAAWLSGRERSRAGAAAFALAGVGTGLVMGSGLLGADVGGVITASIGGAVAAIVMLPTPIPRKYAVAAAIAAPILAIAVLALLDLVSGANSHFTRQVLNSHDGANLWDTIVRRYEVAFNALLRGKMPVVVGLCIAAVVVGLRRRATLYADSPGPAWHAALLGALAAGIGGALTNDSGPLLFVVSVFMLVLATLYLRGRPECANTPHEPSSPMGHDVPMAVGAR